MTKSRKKNADQSPDDALSAIQRSLEDLLIATLALAGSRQTEIRDVVGVGIVRVNRIAKILRAAKRREKEVEK